MSSSEKTQYQSFDELKQSQDLSLDQRKPPSDVPGYSLQSFIGSGAYGEVWLGIDRKTGRKVAIKFYTRKTSLDFTMLSREVEKLVFLSADRYVVQLLDVGWDAQPPYYVMDYIEHGSLEEELKEKKTVPVDEAVELFEEIAIGLMHLHGKGILHCDLKPGNVLLDQDKKPRLADFGQSRLSHEQAPALGTLFFMAPEQADLKAVPDARWDVYALGALLYCMLTGNPPYRDEAMVQKLENCEGLEERLKAYKRQIQTAPKPTAHRQVPGVDKFLGDIIGRCISGDPKQRFSSIQSVLVALRQRKSALARRPLMLLGVLGPLLLLVLMGGFAWWTYDFAVTKSDEEFTEKAIESNRWAARFASRAVAERIEDYFDAVEFKSESKSFRDLYRAYLQNDDLQKLAVKFADPNDNLNPELDDEREQFRQNEVRRLLNKEIDSWMSNKKLPKAASWFVCDRYGNQVAAQWDIEPDMVTIAQNWSYRSYFHIDRQDALKESDDGQTIYLANGFEGKHIIGQKVSAVFKSRATNTWKVAFSVPLLMDLDLNDDVDKIEFAGIVGMTVEMGEFISFEIGRNQYAMLVNGLPGKNRGIVLEHPLIRRKQKELQGMVKRNELAKEEAKLPDELTSARLDMSNIRQVNDDFVDPNLEDPMGYDPYQRGDNQRWIAAYIPVKRLVDERANGGSLYEGSMDSQVVDPMESEFGEDTGLYLVAVDDANSVLEPSRDLGRSLMSFGILALMAFLGVTGILAYLVFRSIRQSNRSVSRFYGGGTGTGTSSVHEAKTLLANDSSART